jgi:GNAT superfamily N-acetyltransferase
MRTSNSLRRCLTSCMADPPTPTLCMGEVIGELVGGSGSEASVPVRRVIDAVGRYGARSVGRQVAARILYMRETHLWYELDLARHSDQENASEHFRLVEGTAESIPAVQRLQPASEDRLLERIERGARLWIALIHDEVAFACWTFAGTTPVLIARGGWLLLPEGVECLEDSVTSPDFRGRGIAPKVWNVIAARRRGAARSLITKVGVANVASSRAVAKAGFEEIAVMNSIRLGPRLRVGVHASRTGTGRHLAEQLER